MRSKIKFAALLLSLFLSACGSDTKHSIPPSGSLAGNWQISMQDSSNTLPPVTQSGFLLQNNGSISGSLMVNDGVCSSVGSVEGTLSGSTLSVTENPAGLTVSLDGTLGLDQSTMSGNYTILSMGCNDSASAPQAGSFTANLVPPLNGTVTGTFTAKDGITTFAVTGQISQATNTGVSSIPLSGNFNLAGFCYPTVTVAGAISGTSVAMTLLDPTGTVAGQLIGTTSLDGTTVTGTYKYLGLGKNGSLECKPNGSGTLSFTL
jgi:hypothetical protein